jgi:hypothetical protein
MSFALGDTDSPPFGHTPYEHLLGIYRKSTGVDLIPIFDAIQADLGDAIGEAAFIEELTRRARFIDHMEAILQGRPQVELEQLAVYEVTHYWFFFHHYIGGQRVFRIHSELAKALNDTDLRVPAAYLALPFEGLCLSYEGDILSLEAPELGVPGGSLDAVYVTSFLGRMAKAKNLGHNPRRFGFYAKASGRSEEEPFGLAFMGLLPTTGQGDELVDEAFIDRSVPPEGVSDPRLEVLKLTLKTIAYINSAGADAVELPAPAAEIEERLRRVGPSKMAKLERRLSRLSHQPYIYVGSHLPKAREAPVVIPEHGVRKLTYAFMVRGHFHGFWKLKENILPEEETVIRQEDVDDRGRVWVLVLKWVHPYEKGPEEAEKIHREYFVK